MNLNTDNPYYFNPQESYLVIEQSARDLSTGYRAVATRLNGFFIPESHEVGKPQARSMIIDYVCSSGGHGQSLD